MNINYFEKLEFNKIKELLSSFSSTYIGNNLSLNLQPSNKLDNVKKMLEETQEALNLIERNSSPSFYEIADITVHLKKLESNNILSAKYLLELTTLLALLMNLQ